MVIFKSPILFTSRFRVLMPLKFFHGSGYWGQGSLQASLHAASVAFRRWATQHGIERHVFEYDLLPPWALNPKKNIALDISRYAPNPYSTILHAP